MAPPLDPERIVEVLGKEAESFRRDGAELRFCAIVGAGIAAFQIGFLLSPGDYEVSTSILWVLKAGIIASLLFALSAFSAAVWSVTNAGFITTQSVKSALGDKAAFFDSRSALAWLETQEDKRQSSVWFKIVVCVLALSFVGMVASVGLLLFLI